MSTEHGNNLEDTSGAGSEVSVYDFRRPNRVSKDRMRTIQAIFDRLVSSFGLAFQQRLRSQVQIDLAELTQMTFGEYAAQLANPCSAFVYELGDDDDTEAMFDFGQALPFHVIDRLFGGQGEAYEANRPLTATEHKAFRQQVVDRLMNLFADAWQDHIPFKPQYSGFEFTPEMLEVAMREDPVLVAVLRINVQDITSTFSLCLPIATLEPFLALSGNGRLSVPTRTKVRSTEEDRKIIERHVLEADAGISARIAPFQLRAQDVARIQVGTTINTGVSCATEVDLVIGARPHFRGTATLSGSLLAVQITKPFLDPAEARSGLAAGRLMPREGETDEGAKPSGGALGELNLPVIVEIGRATVSVGRLVAFGDETVVELDRHKGEDVDVFVAGRLFARAQVVELDSAGDGEQARYYGLTITELVQEGETASDAAIQELKALDSLTLPISAEIGRTWMSTVQITRVGRGSVIELTRRFAEPCEVFVAGRRFAIGDVVQVEEHFGVRIKDRAGSLSAVLPDLENLAVPTEPEEGSLLSPLHDLVMPVCVEVGRARKRVGDIISLAEGDVLVLDRFAGEPCDVYVGGQRFAEGEVVHVGDRYGVKVTNVIAPPRTGVNNS